jgi:N-formylglutamate amidohydrolase
MSAVFDFIDGESPLLVSIPHDGRELAPGMAARMTTAGRALPDTDWHVRRLYDFAEELGASVIAANYSRYVVDLNRSADDVALYPGQVSTGLCPLETFAGEPIYSGNAELSEAERRARVETYWRPYHDRLQQALARIVDRFGYALLWDAHSIRAEVPLLFDGRLPDLNIGTNAGASCRDDLPGQQAPWRQPRPIRASSTGVSKAASLPGTTATRTMAYTLSSWKSPSAPTWTKPASSTCRQSQRGCER